MSDRYSELIQLADEEQRKHREAEASGDEEAATLHYQAAVRALREAWILARGPGLQTEKVK